MGGEKESWDRRDGEKCGWVGEQGWRGRWDLQPELAPELILSGKSFANCSMALILQSLLEYY